ncbi:hypothetical protein LXT21_15565 [Myxococcus sp. K38C18041901]|uniref:glycosyltransferase family 32 protein n=1 Tax=Myxococcus guangdongensis TaxID=2906760 RepID=UPI0020A75E85|nr:TcdA/TcdB catalytic glycosyltransferase domain-containing protein [Myxococcus guangdongensis]MCP3060201.1 hypothetical protein [Myxococcus guangdongensis]
MPVAEPFPGAIPKKLHFIWMGRPVPEKYLANITSFAFRNPNYEINLWSTSADRFRTSMAGLRMQGSNWRFRTLAELNLHPRYRHWIDFETRGYLVNFAAASDLLRLAILHQEGGVYTDTDNLALAAFGELWAEYGFLLAKAGLDNNTLTNALMASVPGNPYVNVMGLHILDKYDTTDPDLLERKRVPGTLARRSMTIEMSGPGALSLALDGYGHHEQRTLTKVRHVRDASGARRSVKTEQVVTTFVQDLLHGGFAPHPKVCFPQGLVRVASDKTWLGTRPPSAESPL